MLWKEPRVLPFQSHAQFHPPSLIRWSANHVTSPSTSAPSQVPLAKVEALMQQSASPPQ